MRHKTAIAVSAVLASAMLSSCATYTGQTSAPDDPNRTRNNALIGAGIGAVAGLLSGGEPPSVASARCGVAWAAAGGAWAHTIQP